MDITLAGGAIAYAPNDDQLAGVSLEFAAFDGEVGNGLLPVPDPLAAITVAGGRAAVVEEGTTLLTDGFILDQDRVRGPQPAGTAREHTFGIVDANALLDGFRAVRSRGAETDYARVIAFAALDGPTWDTTMVLNASTVTLPAKRYDQDGGWAELISDLVEFTGKTLFLHDKAAGGRCLHYHLLTNGHTCGLTISDVAGAQDLVTVFAPHEPARNRTSVDLRNDIMGRDQAGRTSTVTDGTSITAHDADGLQHQSLQDFDTTSQADLDLKTAAMLASLKDESDTYTCSIGPLDETALALIRVGDLMTVTSTVMGLTASVQRISHMTLTVFVGENGRARPGLWLAALELGAPVRRRARVKPSLVGTVPDPTNPPPASLPFDDSGGQFVAVGGAGKIATSPSGTTWTLQTSGASTWRAVAWSPEVRLYVIGSSAGDISTSPDGVTWTTRTSGFTQNIYDIAWSPALGLFVAVGGRGELATSTDGITWTHHISGFATGVADTIAGVCWSPALARFVAVGIDSGVNGQIATSPDGVNWTQRTVTINNDFINKVAWSPTLNLFLAVGGAGEGATSADGITWNVVQVIDVALNSLNGVAWSSPLSLFVVVGGTGKLFTSPNGSTWTSRTSGFGTTTIHGVGWGDGVFVAVGEVAKLTTSTDGITWTARTSGFTGDVIYDVVPGSGLTPVVAQVISEVIGTGDGVRTLFATTWPYLGGSLFAFANGYPEYLVTETNPTAGTLTFQSAPFSAEEIRVEYRKR